MNRINDEFRADSRKSPRELEREIDATRAELLATIEELEHRLSPTDLLSDLWLQMRRHGGEFGGSLGQSLKDNPMPALLTSIGIAWMMTANGRPRHDDMGHGVSGHAGNGSSRLHETGERLRRTGSRMRRRMHDAQDRVHGMRESMKDRADHAREGAASAGEKVAQSAQHVRERAMSMTDSARHRAQYARSGLRSLLDDQPLLLGAIGLAAGVIAGAALPPTEQEDRAFGPARDRALDRAKRMNAEGARRVREHVEEAAEATRTALHGNDTRKDSRTDARGNTGTDTGTTPQDHLAARAGGSADQAPGTKPSSPGTNLGY